MYPYVQNSMIIVQLILVAIPVSKKVTIGDCVWIGPNAILLPSITIGEGAVVAAGSVVTHDVAPYTVVGGIPAKKINDRPCGLTYVFEGKES